MAHLEHDGGHAHEHGRQAKPDTARPGRRGAAPALPASIHSSLMKGPKGGEPVMAKKPISHKNPERGKARSRPRTSPTDLVRPAARMLPAVKNSMALVKEWLTAWSMAAGAAAPKPTPKASMPICSTLE